jgi:thioesterase domain-containing protein
MRLAHGAVVCCGGRQVQDGSLDQAHSLAWLRTQLDRIPLVSAMQVQVVDLEQGRLCLRAPLAANVNDKGSAFGGSLVSLMTLAGWALASVQLMRAGHRAEVYVADSQVRYLAPLHGPLDAVAWLEQGSWEEFLATFASRRRARCTIAASIGLAGGGEATVMTSRYVALGQA